MRSKTLVVILSLWLCACGQSTAPDRAGARALLTDLPEPPPDFPGQTNTVPPTPVPGESRAGMFYDIYLVSPNAEDEQMAITVFEPTRFEGGKKYPLILQQHGFGGNRVKDLGAPPTTSVLGGGTDIRPFLDAGYGVISIDQRGHGESGGTIRAMDPDFEGRNLVAILNWAEVRLDWLMRGPDLDGGNDNLVVGGIGGSYGGGFQMILHAIDPRHRMDAMVPQISWNSLANSLFPNNVIKMGWVEALLAVGTAAGSGLDRGHFDPYAYDSVIAGIASNKPSSFDLDYYHYHSLAYFCEGRPVATNGGDGTQPMLPPNPPGAVHALFMQGMRDTLFTFNEAFRNYDCLRHKGGDVRLMTYEGGHNSLLLVPDPGALVYEEIIDGGAGATLERSCAGLGHEAATLAFFEEHLKGIAGAAAIVPRQPCMSLGANGDHLLVDEVLVGAAGTEFELPSKRVMSGLAEAPTVVDIGYAAPEDGAVLAGIPRIEVNVQPAAGPVGAELEPIIFIGVGRYRLPESAPMPGVAPPLAVDLVDNQITPLRGFGSHSVDLIGIGERLTPGDRVAILLYGGHDQYHVTGGLNIGSPGPALVSVEGRVWLPLQ